MKLVALFLIVPLGYLAIRLLEEFLRRSLNSFRHADCVWSDLSQTARDLAEADVPTSVRRVVLALMMSAGCGCYVRGMFVSHFLPRIFLGIRGGEKNRRGQWDQAFFDVDALPAPLSKEFSKLIALVVVYDSYRNPLQGYFFRRLIRSISKIKLDYGTHAEAELTAFSVISKRSSGGLIPAIA